LTNSRAHIAIAEAASRLTHSIRLVVSPVLGDLVSEDLDLALEDLDLEDLFLEDLSLEDLSEELLEEPLEVEGFSEVSSLTSQFATRVSGKLSV
jgi:hypothetical protein